MRAYILGSIWRIPRYLSIHRTPESARVHCVISRVHDYCLVTMVAFHNNGLWLMINSSLDINDDTLFIFTFSRAGIEKTPPLFLWFTLCRNVAIDKLGKFSNERPSLKISDGKFDKFEKFSAGKLADRFSVKLLFLPSDPFRKILPRKAESRYPSHLENFLKNSYPMCSIARTRTISMNC